MLHITTNYKTFRSFFFVTSANRY
uniref:Uncharacterized protein n=1 Tax=Zea mays TaxID=4577 RepID=C4J781_MAIZE|nr:unknown [Zea mays]